jgi:hypothetical protein
MLKSSRLLRLCGRIMAIVMLQSFLTICPVYGEQPTVPLPTLSENEMKRWSDLEIECLAELDALIDEISEIAIEAIEQAAAEAAKAAALEMLEREAAAMREAARWRMEAELQTEAVKQAKKAGVKNTVIAALVGIFGGLVVGVGGTMLMRN